jgi:hypothetical protein
MLTYVCNTHADPVEQVWFYKNDSSEFDLFEAGRTPPHRCIRQHTTAYVSIR